MLGEAGAAGAFRGGELAVGVHGEDASHNLYFIFDDDDFCRHSCSTPLMKRSTLVAHLNSANAVERSVEQTRPPRRKDHGPRALTITRTGSFENRTPVEHAAEQAKPWHPKDC
ncbi:hypothetical protein NLX83_16585 [Allokutzneria sp. A3M-2-11 16]|uniref:hypothetical protein n=1 Tax=Allokutzneria sp. A3M-2-11 16 TaxID=2962043 RepID=UPI0020B84E75|nr:hypothetical protein [Allokutzneria sp. A3M-2-11 16]MCP3800884.1 hypothetical protein [Allokutzneria sp. A3M-2-11 16]